MRVLVCGDRNWRRKDYVFGVLDTSSYASFIIEGGAAGADFFAREWAVSRNVTFEEYPAEWEQYGKAAGPIRNAQMIKDGKPELVIAFHQDIKNSKGTADMIKQARKAKIPVILFTGEGRRNDHYGS